MTLDAGDRSRIDGIGLSYVAYHDAPCCPESRQLILAKLQQYPDIGSQLAAIPVTFQWGPTKWPVHWCELLAPKTPVADCGVHAQLASELLWAYGIPHVRGRAAIRAGTTSVEHWTATWSEAEAGCAWLGDDVVHHEVLRVGDRWWDATEARWFAGPGAALVAGIVVAVREEGGDWQGVR